MRLPVVTQISTCRSKHPQLGIFWLVPQLRGLQILVGFAHAFDDVPTIGGFKTLDDGHIDLWPILTREYRHLANQEYDDHPRGRVNWRESDGCFLLFADRRILNAGYHRVLIEAWSLPAPRTRVSPDEHYR